MTSGAAPTASGEALHGLVRGGQQPIAGASIALYQAGTTGNGTGAASLLHHGVTVTSDPNGNFSITGDYTCPSSTTQVYLVASGGNPGLTASTNNAAILLMTALGNCGNLNSSTFVTIDEVTTAGAVWALQPFLGAGGVVGSSASNATGLSNAFLNAANLADSAGGVSPGTALPSGATMESAKLNTVADALASCVNSDGTTACVPLWTASTDGGVTPSNTLDAALAIVRNLTAHLTDVLNAAGASGPFQPALTGPPNDWTMTVDYTGGGLNSPSALGVDSNGNVWVANYFGGAVSEFTNAGVPVAANGFAGNTEESYGLTVDGSNNVWVANEQTAYAVNTADGSVTEFNSAGQVVSGNGYAGGGVFFPVALAADSNGKVWVADYGRSEATLLNGDGSAYGSSPFSGGALAFPSAVALDGSHNAWFASQGGVVGISPSGSFTSYSCCANPSGVAVDQGGNIWLADYGGGRLVEFSSSGSKLATPTAIGGLNHPQGIAVDGAGTVWNTNYRASGISAFSGYASASPGAALSPSTGFGTAAGLLEAYGIAIDASGNVWVSSYATNTLTEFVGAASPIQTPLLGPPSQP